MDPVQKPPGYLQFNQPLKQDIITKNAGAFAQTKVCLDASLFCY